MLALYFASQNLALSRHYALIASSLSGSLCREDVCP
jgi:hypothetical protein